jgi:hypothetical protein
MSKYIIGTISHATMRAQDLIPVFVTALKSLDQTLGQDHLDVIMEGEAIIAKGDWDTEDTSMYLNEDLFEALNDCAPPYFYFGSHPGDGSDYGFWLDEEIGEIFDGLKVSDLSEVPADYQGEVLLINDHGNTSLYAVNDKGSMDEIWGIV